MQTLATTPFGRRPLTRAMLARQAATQAFTEQDGAAEAAAHKWRLFRALTEAKGALGVSDRALSVLHALLSFHQETVLALGPAAARADGDRAGLVVFPSNRELSIRAHGMAPATLRRHLASLVEAGLILRRDSPNGKRFARKGQGGEIAEAFGFDLTPLLARAAEIERLAEAARAEARALALLREKITLARRDIAKMIEMGLAEDGAADWMAVQGALAALCGRCVRRLPHESLAALAADFAHLAETSRKLLEIEPKLEKKSANESQIERHIQNQTTEIPDLEPCRRDGRGDAPGSTPSAGASPQTPARRDGAGRAYPLGMVLDACPDIVDYARGGEIASWRDLADAAATVRAALGVSPDAWAQAIDAMGAQDAAVVLAAILQRGEAITSAGGYLRVLTAKARAGEFSLGPLLMAQLRGKTARAGRRAG